VYEHVQHESTEVAFRPVAFIARYNSAKAAIDYLAGAETRNRPLFDHLLQQKPGDRIDLR
jgi:hypothetical protein